MTGQRPHCVGVQYLDGHMTLINMIFDAYAL